MTQSVTPEQQGRLQGATIERAKAVPSCWGPFLFTLTFAWFSAILRR